MNIREHLTCFVLSHDGCARSKQFIGDVVEKDIADILAQHSGDSLELFAPIFGEQIQINLHVVVQCSNHSAHDLGAGHQIHQFIDLILEIGDGLFPFRSHIPSTGYLAVVDRMRSHGILNSIGQIS